MNAKKKSVVLPLILLLILLAALAAIITYIVHLHRMNTVPKPPEATPTPSLLILTPEPTQTPAPEPEQTATPVPAAEATAEPQWQFQANADRFWQENALRLSGSYRSPSLSVRVDTVVDTVTFGRRVTYYVADIFVRDVTQIRTESCRGDFSRAGHGSVSKTAKAVHAMVAISGDYCGFHRDSLVIRNGIVYRKSVRTDMDVCLILRDGTMETIQGRNVVLSEILKMDVWQAWQFGPALLNEEGDARTAFPGCSVVGRNPRCCIGYVDPGHYKFVVVDGRQKESRGVTMKELAALMESLGCRRAFNLDGGNSAHFFWHDQIFSSPSGGGRQISDIIYVAKEDYPDAVYFRGKDGIKKK